MRSLWAEVAELVARGRRPGVTFPRALEVIEPPRRVGRPRVHPVGARRGRETGYALVTASGRPMRCRARGCSRTLKKNAVSICCSKTCEFLLRSECEAFLEVLDGKVEARHLSPVLRTINTKARHAEWDARAGLLPERRRRRG